jgi:aspartate ammonia-lyase
MRIEKDSIGELQIEDNAFYGIQSLRASENFKISGTQVHPELIRCYLLLKKSAVIANNKLNLIDSKKAGAIVSAIDDLLLINNTKERSNYFIIDAYQAGAGTSQNMNLNEVIANKANENLGFMLGSYHEINPNDHVNMSQSTNDTYPTAMKLATLSLSKKLINELNLFSNSLGNKEKEFDHILKSGRTHLQDAVPIRLGQEFGAYKKTILQLITLTLESQNYLRILGIGGSAVGTGLNVPNGYREIVINELQVYFDDFNLSLSPNLIESMQSQLPMMIYSNSLRAIALEFTRIINDLRLLSSGPKTGLSEIILPQSQPGSSIMPGKINPSLLEMGNQVFFKVLGNDTAMAFAIQAGQLELNVMMPLMAHLCLESTQIIINAISSIRLKCIDSISANEARCEEFLQQSTQLATAISPIIGYAKVAELTKEAISKNIPIMELIKEKKILTEDQFKKIFNIRKMTEPQ